MRLRLALVLVAVAALTACRGGTSRRPPIHPNPNMDNQMRFDAQEANSFFADGRAFRDPVAGVVRAGSYKPDEHLLQGTIGGQPAATLPASLPLTAELLARGRERFDIYCMPCHDSTGSGKGSIVERGMFPPPSFHDDRLRGQGIGYFHGVITNGIRNMPAYAGQIPVNDRWAIAAYVRALQISQAASLPQVPVAVAKEKGWGP